MTADVKAIVSRYVAAAKAHGEGTENGNYKLANRSYHKIIKALRELDSVATVGRGALRDVLEHDDPHVRGWAATHLLGTCPEEAIVVLEDIAQLPGIAGFDAQMVLKEWRGGTVGMGEP